MNENEYEIGKDYTFTDGTTWTYLGGDPDSRDSWAPAVDPPGSPRRPSLQMDTTDPRSVGALRRGDGGNNIRSFLNLLLHGASMGMSDEMAGHAAEAASMGRRGPVMPTEQFGGFRVDAGPRERDRAAGQAAAADRRASVAASREDVGLVPSIIAEAAPSLILPGVAAVAAPKAGVGLLGSAARTGAVSGMEAFGYGTAEAEGSLPERATAGAGAALVGAPAGAFAGMLPTIANAIRRPAGGRGPRVAESLRRTSRNAGDVNSWRKSLREYRDQARQHFYGPLEQAHREIKDQAFIDFLRRPDVIEHTRAVASDVASGKRGPSFREVQRIRSRMNRANRGVAQQGMLTEQIEQFNQLGHGAVRGWDIADRAYARANAWIDALDDGRKHWNKSAADIDEITKTMDQTGREAFRTGQLHEILRRLERRDDAALAQLRDLMDSGPEMERVTRTLFKDDESYRQFRELVMTEVSAARVSQFMRSKLPWLLAGAGAAAGGSALF